MVTSKGKRMPLDRDPTPNGNVVYSREQPYDDIDMVDVLGKEQQEQLPERRARWKSHFATCPESREWRKEGER